MQTIADTNTNPTTPTTFNRGLLLICADHGPQDKINMRGLQTEHLILGCGCAFQLTDEGPLYDGNANDEPDFFEESRRCFIDAKGIEIPAFEYFRRLESIHKLKPDVENYISLDELKEKYKGTIYEL